MTGALVLIGTLVLAGAAGLVLRARQGRVRPSASADAPVPDDVRRVLDPDAAVTLVQLSTTFCAPCRHARVLLADLAAHTDGLHHAELDLTERPELARALSVFRTPTTLAVDATGSELLRVGGVPRRDDLLEALRPHLPSGN
ncbi:MAG TPA: thioredoxin family protein [Actinophytocola sp.]|uniref:TlpA family protein disulfide reductase n=1 Tax=Actinophytocola sp. TaxID=1872138 RepID=UPI002DDCCE3F|nr:thioredoxin family protein [Actinophytocola sp.]HEV2781379.1 thioredoxin family protein [Actinophytocola sp.]